MDPLYDKRDVEYTNPEIRVIPRCISWNFPEELHVRGRPALGPSNPMNWWLFGRNWLVIPLREGTEGA
jgi:hypothetical protein